MAAWWNRSAQPSEPARLLSDAAKQQPFVGQVNWLPVAENHPVFNQFISDKIFSTLPEVRANRQKLDSFLGNGGWDILKWTPCGASPDQDLVALNDYYNFDNPLFFDPVVLDSVRCRGQIYALPIGLHRVNHVITSLDNSDQCDPLQVTDPASFETYLTCLQDNSATHHAPLIVPQDDDGQGVQFLIENLMLLSAQHDGYKEYWQFTMPSERDARQSGRAQLLNALHWLTDLGKRGLVQFSPTTGFATTALVDGKASLMVMPDWYRSTRAFLQSGGLGTAPFPGTEGTYLFTSDVFAVPVPLPSNRLGAEAGLRWLDELARPEVQNRFAELKQALPASKAAYQFPFNFELPLRLVSALEGQMPLAPEIVRTELLQWSNNITFDNTREAAASNDELSRLTHIKLQDFFCRHNQPENAFEFRGSQEGRGVYVAVRPPETDFTRAFEELCSG